MAKPNKPSKKKYTYADYLTWPEDERWELIDGEAFDMTPAPGRHHQRLCLRIAYLLETFFEGKTCEVNIAPFDVRIPHRKEADDKIDCVVQPDITVVCTPEKLDDRGCRGAPDLVVEILSPSTASYDAIRKRRFYERVGVKEYWLVDPGNRLLIVHGLQKNGCFSGVEFFSDESRLTTKLFPGLEIDLSKVFPPLQKIVRESPRKYASKKS